LCAHIAVFVVVIRIWSCSRWGLKPFIFHYRSEAPIKEFVSRPFAVRYLLLCLFRLLLALWRVKCQGEFVLYARALLFWGEYGMGRAF
jgi:hypothetical protein